MTFKNMKGSVNMKKNTPYILQLSSETKLKKFRVKALYSGSTKFDYTRAGVECKNTVAIISPSLPKVFGK